MSRTLLSLLCLVVIVVLALVGSRYQADPAPPTPADTTSGASGGPAAAAAGTPSSPAVRGLVGRVVDPLGTPVVGAGVQAIAGDGSDAPVDRTTTDLSGSFHLLPSAAEVTLLVDHLEFAPQVLRKGVSVEETQVDLGDLVLVEYPGLLVEIRSASGTPLAEATVEIRPELRDLARPAALATAVTVTTRTGEDGTAVFYGLAPGWWRVTASAAGCATEESHHQQPRDPETSPRVILQLPLGLVVRGRVVDPEGEGLADAVVRSRAVGREDPPIHRSRTDADGNFRLDGLRRGEHELLVQHPEHQVYLQAHSVPEEGPMTIHMTPGLQVAGRVLHGRTKLPISGAMVRAVTDADWQIRWHGEIEPVELATDEAGKFHFRGLSPGITTLIASSAGFAPTTTATPVRLPDATGSPIDVTVLLEEEFRLTGQVLSPAGLPLEKARIDVIPYPDDLVLGRGGEAPAPVETQTGGRFSLDGLPQGEYRTRVRASGLPLTLGPVFSASPGESRDVGTIRMRSGRAVHGTASDAEGRPAAGATVYLAPDQASASAGRPALQTRCDGLGRFRFSMVAAGTYLMFYDYPDKQLPTRAAATRGATTVTLELGESPPPGAGPQLQDLKPR